MKRDINREIALLEELHEKNLLRRNLTAICIISVIFIIAPILLDMTDITCVMNLLEHIVVAVINAVLYYFINAIIFSFILTPSVEETCRIKQLKIEKAKGEYCD